MTFIVKTSGAPRPVRKDFRCPRGHGVFTDLVDSDAEWACCPLVDEDDEICNEPSPWSPSPIPMRMRRVEATKGRNEAPEHADWDFTRNLEEGQPPEEWQADRDAAAERRDDAMVMDMIRSDR